MGRNLYIGQLFNKKVELPREDEPAGNAYAIMGFITDLMEDAFEATKDPRFNKKAQDEYLRDATSGNYAHLRDVSQKVADLMNDYSPKQD